MKNPFFTIIMIFFLVFIKPNPGSTQSFLSYTFSDPVLFSQLWIQKPTLTFKTDHELLIANNFNRIIEIGLIGKKDWLEVVADSTRFNSLNRFTVESDIRDFKEYIRINIHITSLQIENEKHLNQKIFFDIKPDSMLTSLEKISSELSFIIYNATLSTKKKVNNIIIQSFIVELPDTDTSGIGEYLSLLLSSDLEQNPSILSVKYISSRIDDTLKRNYNFLISGSYLRQIDNNYYVNAIVTDLRTNKKVFSINEVLETYGLQLAVNKISEEISDFIAVYYTIEESLESAESSEDLYTYGESFYENQDEPDALLKAKVFYRLAVQQDDTYVPAINKLGEIEYNVANYEKSLAFYKTAVNIEPDNIESHLGLGKVFYQHYGDDQAIKEFKIAANLGKKQKNPIHEAKAYYWIGETYTSNADYKSALKNFQKSREIYNGDQIVWHYIGSTYFSLYLEESKPHIDTTFIYYSLQTFEKGAEMFTDSTFEYNKAYILNYWGKMYYEEISNQSSNGSYNEYLVKAYNKFQESSIIQHYEDKLLAENFTYLAYLDYLYFYNTSEGVSYIRKAYDLGVEDEWTFRMFGYIHLLEGNPDYYQEAKIALQKAINISKTYRAYSVLGDIYYELAQYDSAAFAYEKSIELDTENNLKNENIHDLYSSTTMINNSNVYEIARNRLQSEIQNDFSNYPKDEAYIQYINLDILQYGKDVPYVDYVKKSFEYNPISQEAFAFLDTLYQTHNDTLALNLRIEQQEINLSESESFRGVWNLGFNYYLLGKGEKCINLVESKGAFMESKFDTAEAYCLIGLGKLALGEKAINNNAKAEANEYFESSIENFEKASDLIPEWTTPLEGFMVIYHEYYSDYAKAYDYGKQLFRLDSSNISCQTNFIESTLTFEKFEETINIGEKFLSSDSIGDSRIPARYKLITRFFIMTAKVLNDDILGAYSNFGEFKRIYGKVNYIKLDWMLDGTKSFLQSYNEIDPELMNIILDILETLEVPSKSNLEKLDLITKDWEELILASRL